MMLEGLNSGCCHERMRTGIKRLKPELRRLGGEAAFQPANMEPTTCTGISGKVPFGAFSGG